MDVVEEVQLTYKMSKQDIFILYCILYVVGSYIVLSCSFINKIPAQAEYYVGDQQNEMSSRISLIARERQIDIKAKLDK